MGHFDPIHSNRAEYVSNLASSMAINIRAYRERQRLSQKQLALQAGVSEDTIIKIESGNAAVLSNLIFQVCWALQLQPIELFGFIQSRPDITATEYSLVLAVRKLYPDSH